MKKAGQIKIIENPEIGKEELEHPTDSKSNVYKKV